MKQAAGADLKSFLVLLSFLSQFFGPWVALKTDWVSHVAPDLQTWAAGLSFLVSVAGYLLASIDASIIHASSPPNLARVRQYVLRASVWMAVFFLAYWAMNAVYTTESGIPVVAFLAQAAFVFFYALPFGFLTYAYVLVVQT